MADTRLAQHIEKGNEDGLYISSVASSQNLWALIMDAGTGFTSQVYELSPTCLHKVHTHAFKKPEVMVFFGIMTYFTGSCTLTLSFYCTQAKILHKIYFMFVYSKCIF